MLLYVGFCEYLEEMKCIFSQSPQPNTMVQRRTHSRNKNQNRDPDTFEPQ